ncbi:MAG TPA: MerR family transcriptional regulator [Prolixibacteraceae bacterium]|nr:MerR family transcriptional regulator [Prolixibacteraceae bacterium]
MKHYSIGELELLSRIKTHTIRVWEQRYKLLEPERTEGNTRFYNESQLKKLLKVALLNKSGIKISHIVEMSDQELSQKADEIILNTGNIDLAVEQLMNASLNFDQNKTKTFFDQYIKLYGIENTFEKIILPYLRIVGNLWVSGKITPGHEHFFTNLCKLKLFAEIDKLELPTNKESGVLLFQPEWDYHELGILYYMYLFTKAGYFCTYLGQAVPIKDAIQTANTLKKKHIITTFIGPTTQENVLEYIDKLVTETKNNTIYVSGPHVDFPLTQYKKRVMVFQSVNDLITLFKLK